MNTVGLTYLTLERRKQRRTIAMNTLAIIAIVLTFCFVSTWDARDAEAEAQRMVDRALHAIAHSEPVRSRVSALAHCKAPRHGQVLVMRHDAQMPSGFACATYERYDWPHTPVLVSK